MNMNFSLESGDFCSCGNAYNDYKDIPHQMLDRADLISVNDKLSYTDSNYNSGSECSGSYTQRVDGGLSYRLNGWKMLAAVALHAWRKRRKEFKAAMEAVEKLQMEAACSKSQLQVYTTLIRVEQKRNDELTCQLKRTLNNLNKSKSSCDSMSATLISLKADKSLLEQELKVKYEEYDALHSVLAQTKTDLFRSMMETRNLQSQLSNEQRSVQALENQKNQLINEIYDHNAETRKIEEDFKIQFEEKQQQLNEMREKLRALQPTLHELKEKLDTKSSKYEDQMANEVKQLRIQVAALQSEIDESLYNRLRFIWKIFIDSQISTFRFVHFLAYYLLPATPPPLKIKFKSKKG